MFKRITSVVLSILLVQLQIAMVFGQNQNDKRPDFEKIYTDYSFIETAELTNFFKYSSDEIKKELEKIDKKEKEEVERTEKEQEKAKKEFGKFEKELNNNTNAKKAIERKYETEKVIEENGKKRKETVPADLNALAKDPQYQKLEQEREGIKCRVEEWRMKSDKVVFQFKRDQIKRGYEVQKTQLDLLLNWPSEEVKIQEDKKSGVADRRKFGNAEDIGLRDLGFGDQTDDIKILQDPQLQQELKEIKPKEYKNIYVKTYVADLVQKIVKNSDVKIPIKDENIIVISDDDINAFAVGGGLVVVMTGLLEKVNNEAELAGVLSHELGHVAARHSARLMKKATIAGIIFQAAQVAALIFTGGAYTLATYYLLQGITTGIGLAISLVFLGVSRDYEVEADTLGMQYLKKSGYDPMSFMNFFEKMGKEKGYIRNTSFFRTHPAFAERIVNSLREYEFLAPHGDYEVSSTEFLRMKAILCVTKEMEARNKEKEKENARRPTLHKKEQKEKEEQERARTECGIQKPEDPKKMSFCSSPELQPILEEVRIELEAQAENDEYKIPDRPVLKRP